MPTTSWPAKNKTSNCWQEASSYAPDYIINAGGIINASAEFEPGGYNPKVSRDKVNRIYDHLLQIFRKAEAENKTPSAVADEIAE